MATGDQAVAQNGTSTSEATSTVLQIVGLGNPLLDICANVTQDILTKYDLKLDNAILAEEKHLPLYDELVNNFSAQYIAGGATQNSIRVAQWMLNNVSTSATSFLGCIGSDKFGEVLQECASKDGVNVHYLKVDIPTGTCAVCVLDGERSLIANLSAANMYNVDHLNDEKTKQIVANGSIFYSAGFHLTVCPAAMIKLAEHAVENNKVFMLNLSAPFIVQFFKEPLMKIIPFCDYIFGNESEATEFGKSQGWGDDLEVVAMKLCQMPKQSGSRGRAVVFTQGSKQTIVAYQGKITKYEVPALEKGAIVDTNGAGDAFVGGFLSQLSMGKSIKDCVHAGHWAAQVIIQESGCTFPRACNYKPLE